MKSLAMPSKARFAAALPTTMCSALLRTPDEPTAAEVWAGTVRWSRIFLLFFFLLLNGAGCGGERAWLKTADAQLKEMIELPSSMEARQWLQEERFTEELKQTPKTVVEDLYQAGASKVFFPYVRKPDGSVGSPSSVVIVLPGDVDSRERIFRIVTGLGGAASDLGQGYLYSALP